MDRLCGASMPPAAQLASAKASAKPSGSGVTVFKPAASAPTRMRRSPAETRYKVQRLPNGSALRRRSCWLAAATGAPRSQVRRLPTRRRHRYQDHDRADAEALQQSFRVGGFRPRRRVVRQIIFLETESSFLTELSFLTEAAGVWRAAGAAGMTLASAAGVDRATAAGRSAGNERGKWTRRQWPAARRRQVSSTSCPVAVAAVAAWRESFQTRAAPQKKPSAAAVLR